MPALVQHRASGAPHLGTGAGRIRDDVEQPQRAPDREPDRSAADDRSRIAGHHAFTLGPVTSLLFGPPFVLLTPMPHGEPHHAARVEPRFRVRLWLPRDHPRPSLSSLPRGLSFLKTRLRPRREARLYRLSGKDLLFDGGGCSVDAVGHD